MNASLSPKLKTASASLAALALIGIVPGTLAAEAEYSGTWCGNVKLTMLEAGPELTTLTAETWGIEIPKGRSTPFENGTLHCVGYARTLGGKTHQIGSCRWFDATGDTFSGEYEDVPGMPGKWTFLAGTGKWKGIKGSGTYKTVTASKPAAPGTVQMCKEHSGTYSLP